MNIVRFDRVRWIVFGSDRKQQAERLAGYLTLVRKLNSHVVERHNNWCVEPPSQKSYTISTEEMRGICRHFDLTPHSIGVAFYPEDHLVPIQYWRDKGVPELPAPSSPDDFAEVPFQ